MTCAERHVLIVEDSRGTRAYALDDLPHSIAVGRGDNCPIQLYSRWLSRRHATLLRIPDGRGSISYRLIDGDPESSRRSTNGTFVNKRSIQSYDLQNHDEVRFGSEVRAHYFCLDNDVIPIQTAQDKPREADPRRTMVDEGNIFRTIQA
jgi:pSer/pThr/pTyr-binding forkhead associated (FHA) protein